MTTWGRGIEGRVCFWQPETLWGSFPKSFSFFWTWGQSYQQWRSRVYEHRVWGSPWLLCSRAYRHSKFCLVCVHVCACLSVCVRVEIRGRPQTLVFTFHFVWDRLLVAACPRLAGLRASRNVPVSTSHVTMGTLDYRHALSSPKETKCTEK